MADYYPLIARAVDGLSDGSPAMRSAIYERARTALIEQLRSLDPPLAEADIERERVALDDAIARVEAERRLRHRRPPIRPRRRPTRRPRLRRPTRRLRPRRPTRRHRPPLRRRASRRRPPRSPSPSRRTASRRPTGSPSSRPSPPTSRSPKRPTSRSPRPTTREPSPPTRRSPNPIRPPPVRSVPGSKAARRRSAPRGGEGVAAGHGRPRRRRRDRLSRLDPARQARCRSGRRPRRRRDRESSDGAKFNERVGGGPPTPAPRAAARGEVGAAQRAVLYEEDPTSPRTPKATPGRVTWRHRRRQCRPGPAPCDGRPGPGRGAGSRLHHDPPHPPQRRQHAAGLAHGRDRLLDQGRRERARHPRCRAFAVQGRVFEPRHPGRGPAASPSARTCS